MLTQPHTRRGEVVLETAAIVAELPDQAIISLARMLNLPGGHEQFADLLRHVSRLASAERAELMKALGRRLALTLHVG